MEVTPAQMLDDAYLASRAKLIDMKINLEAAMPAATVQGLPGLGHQMEVLQGFYQDFGTGQFIWRMGGPKVQGYLAASDPRRDGQVAGYRPLTGIDRLEFE